MAKMRLQIFAYHVSSLMTGTGEFGLHPFGDFGVKVKIEPSTAEGFKDDRIWDSVYINGKHCGNRHGGVKVFTEMISALAPEIDFDSDDQAIITSCQ